MSTCWPSMEFVHYIFHFAAGKELELSWAVSTNYQWHSRMSSLATRDLQWARYPL
jgi:hypothetical protein